LTQIRSIFCDQGETAPTLIPSPLSARPLSDHIKLKKCKDLRRKDTDLM